MAQVLRLATEKKKLSLKDMKIFVSTAEQYGLALSETVDVSSKGSELVLTRALPLKVRVVNGKKVVLRQKTNKQRKVEKQIKDHNSKEAKEKPGYVPPEGKKSGPKGKKIKCPVCNTRKPVVKVAGAGTSIKPHVSHGEPCAGSGAQVVGNKVKM
jgi:hypothetical protein